MNTHSSTTLTIASKSFVIGLPWLSVSHSQLKILMRQWQSHYGLFMAKAALATLANQTQKGYCALAPVVSQALAENANKQCGLFVTDQIPPTTSGETRLWVCLFINGLPLAGFGENAHEQAKFPADICLSMAQFKQLLHDRRHADLALFADVEESLNETLETFGEFKPVSLAQLITDTPNLKKFQIRSLKSHLFTKVAITALILMSAFFAAKHYLIPSPKPLPTINVQQRQHDILAFQKHRYLHHLSGKLTHQNGFAQLKAINALTYQLPLVAFGWNLISVSFKAGSSPVATYFMGLGGSVQSAQQLAKQLPLATQDHANVGFLHNDQIANFALNLPKVIHHPIHISGLRHHGEQSRLAFIANLQSMSLPFTLGQTKALHYGFSAQTITFSRLSAKGYQSLMALAKSTPEFVITEIADHIQGQSLFNWTIKGKCYA